METLNLNLPDVEDDLHSFRGKARSNSARRMSFIEIKAVVDKDVRKLEDKAIIEGDTLLGTKLINTKMGEKYKTIERGGVAVDHDLARSEESIGVYVKHQDSDSEADEIIRAYKTQEKERRKAFSVITRRTRASLRKLDALEHVQEHKVKRLFDSVNISVDLQKNKNHFTKNLNAQYNQKLF